ncbi:MAG: chemotaxis protein CheX [Planctomycetota bacterium]|nr:chemotaxis protein CheX [Planctomycetota bacterium]
MDPSLFKPFIASIQNVFSTMLQLPVTVNPPRVKQSPTASYDVSGIIGMTGDVSGSVVLSFPQQTAERIVALFCGQQVQCGTPDFADAVGELVNMVSGNAKALMAGRKVSISCPSVVIGPSHTLANQSDVPCIVIPCVTDCGELAIEIAIQAKAAPAAQPAPATAAQA